MMMMVMMMMMMMILPLYWDSLPLFVLSCLDFCSL